MPFKWRRKKARKYDISTKNLFIVGVYLLDNVYLECTLNAESTGQECLNSIAQRIQLLESHFFGLRYVTKKLHFHWVDLEKPLKKQLDKYAQQASPSHCLYFGVMFYVTGAHKIPDEVARYHYYLQLKNDIIDGRLPCSADQAIRLAAYSLQAEFGDYEQDKYAAEDYLLFPKTMMKDEAIATQLLSEAIAGHASLQGMPPAKAELYYVKEVQMMDGYGAEYYSAKDESRKDLYLGTSYAGIFARYIDVQSTVYYRWAEIAKVTQSKKFLEIDTPKSSVQFQMDETDTAKYVARLALLQRQFYKSSKANLSNSLADLSLNEESEGQAYMDVQPVYFPPDTIQLPAELGHSQTSLSHLQEQRYSHEILQSSQHSLESSTGSQQHIHQFQLQLQPQQQQQQHQQQQANVSTSESENLYQQQLMRQETVTPTPEADPVYVNRAALLPAYRPSPDYESVMQQRMLHQQQQQQHHHHHFDDLTPHLGAAQVYVHPEGMAYSQPEISQNIAAFRDEHGNYANVEALRNYGHSIYANIFQDDHNLYTVRGGERSTNLAVHPTYSSPELNTEVHQQEVFAAGEFNAQEPLSYHYKPPPPYPRASSSTPDLAAQMPANAMHAEPLPDLNLPTLTLQHEGVGMHDFIVQSRLDKSVEDLSGLPNVSYTGSPFAQVTHTNVNPSVDSMASSTGFLVSVDGDTRELGEDDSDAQRTLTRDTAVPKEFTDSTDGQRVLSDDQEDTSSEHSYSTFHAKESEESSDDEAIKLKGTPEKEEPKIQIRMFTPQEAPPPSKIKEEAMLRESFRRLKIARTASMNTNGAGKLRSSLRNVRETSESDTPSDASTLNTVNEQSNTNYPTSLQPATSSSQHFGEQVNPVVGNAEESSAMKEILERLGAPPPYPGKPPPTATDVNNFSNNNNNNVNFNKSVVTKLPSTHSLEQGAVGASGIVNSGTKHYSPTSYAKLSQITVKRSSSVGTAPQSAPLLPPRKENSGKPRAATFNLDTVVPLSKPGIVLYSKDVDTGTSVLRSEATSSVTDSDNDSVKGLSEKDHGRVSERTTGDASAESLAGLHDYSIGSDSDSDTEKTSLDGHHHMGPLKMASMNGLTLSRSVVLSLMNDESRAPTDDRRRMLESKISEGQVYAEFEKIPKKSTVQECNISKTVHNLARNRFKDVLPYDISRVKLAPCKNNPDGYINASHIKLTANDNKWAFIATQAPLANTAIDFWQMIWEGQVDVIAMLTPFEEMGKSKCFVYWPQEAGNEHKQVYGQFEVELQLTDDSICYVTSRIILRHTGSSQEHMVWHLQYTDWPDHGCPEDTYGFLGFVDEIESMSRLAEAEAGRGQKSPVVVHCSAGVGRTGVVILTMVMKWCLEHNHNVDLPKALAGIRNQRMHMVQTMGQYRFIHDTLIQYLKNTRLI